MQDAILNELLDGQYVAARDRFGEGQHSHEDLTIIMLKHQTNHIAHLDQDVHAKIDKLDEKIQGVKDSVHKSISTLTWRMMLAMGLMTSVFTFVVKFQ